MSSVDNISKLSDSDAAQLFGHIEWFRHLTTDHQQALLHTGQRHRFHRGECVFRRDDSIQAVYVLLSGRAKVVQETIDGEEVVLRLIQPGELFGEIVLQQGVAHRKSAFALSDAAVVAFPIYVISEISGDSVVAQLLLNELAGRLLAAEARICDLQTERVAGRIARMLLRLARGCVPESQENPAIRIPITRTELAELCGTTTTTASRILSRWTELGLIESQRGLIVIPCLDTFSRHAQI